MTQQMLTQNEDVNFDMLYPGLTPVKDHGFVLNTLQHLATERNFNKTNFWTLTQYALNAIRSLQKELASAQKSLHEKNDYIEQLERLATTDSLTTLLNRRGFMDALEKELTKTNRDMVKGGLLIMIDLDNFKAINDTYGHQAGDEALVLVAQTLNAHVRKMDTAARMGGDEFVLIFSNAHPVETSARLQKLARKLNSLTLKWKDETIAIRASLGIQPYTKGDRMEVVLSKADSDMYNTKRFKQQARH
tara:strand:+ start:2150 stop:2890 length:741 start_codon:yes stop_codon:yes gene_type:complete